VLTGRNGIISAAKRRAQNAPIQGISSEIGCTAGYLILDESDLYLRKHKLPSSLFPGYCRAVHDANYFVARYAFVIPMIHITAYQATTGAVNWYERLFGMRFNVHPEVELELSAHEQNSYKWDWSMVNLAEVIVNCLFDQVEIGRLEKDQLGTVLELIYSPWEDKKSRRHLQSTYPLLNVPDSLNDQIDLGIEHAFKLLETRLAG
jgi:hypothetical protein